MEMKLSPPASAPINSTIDRSINQSFLFHATKMLFRAAWTLAPEFTLRHLEQRVLTPPHRDYRTEELAFLEQASPLTIPSPEGRLIAWRWGRRQAPTVLLVHGWGGRSTQLHGLIERLIERGYAAVAYDAPGHGMSGRGTSSLPQMLTGLHAVLDHLGPVAALVGHSLGGSTAALAMAQRPRDIGRGVLIAAPASLNASMRGVAAAFDWPESLFSALRTRIETRLGYSWDEFEAGRQIGPQPLLVIHDRNDREVSLADGIRHTQVWPGARLLETAGLGHRRILDDRAVHLACADFLAEDRS